MSRAREPKRRTDFRSADGVLLVLRDPPVAAMPVPGQPPLVPPDPAEGPEILLAVWDDGSVTALNGHVDLGTGIRTALAQIVAEELDVPLDCVHMILGDTCAAPNQGATIASASIQVHAEPLRRAAAQAHAWLQAEAARDPTRSLSRGQLVAGRHVELMLDPAARVKPADDYRIVGTSAPRVDIPRKITGAARFVHDLRVPDMLHGRVVRPPYHGIDHGSFVGNSLESVDESSIAHVPGVVAVVVIRDFVGVVAEREEHAEQAMRALQVRWRDVPALPELSDLGQAIRDNPSKRRVVAEHGDVDTALAAASQRFSRSYVWPYQMHASIGPSCAVAHWRDDGLRVWAGTQYPHGLRADLARLTGLPEPAIEIVRMEASGCYGRNCADDVAADAVLLSRATGKPVRVQLTRDQENLWEPKGAAQLMEVAGGLNADGSVAGYDFESSYPSNGAVTLALLLTGTVAPEPIVYEMGDRTSVPPYRFDHLRVTMKDMAPMLRASWLRGVSALPNSFAHECFVDELATAAGADPVAFRLRLLDDPRAKELLVRTAERAQWVPHTQPQQQPSDGDFLKGRGVAYARYVHGRFPGVGAAWSAWIADVDVNRLTGEVHVRKVVVGSDAGLIVNPAGANHQIHGNVVQTTSRALKEQLPVDVQTNLPAAREWGGYPILSFREVPVIEVVHIPRPDEAPQGLGESASVPGTAAIANAIHDAIGVRLREPPFTAEVVRAALGIDATGASAAVGARPQPPTGIGGIDAREPPLAPGFDADAGSRPMHAPVRRRGVLAIAGAFAAAAVALVASAFGVRPLIAPVSASANVYTATVLERGRQLAAAGNCAVCHTAEGGAPNAGGRPMETPFGIVWSSNLTPDRETGIGAWSFSAFQRAMREGISRDGRHLYPVFPYTAFARITDDDMTALYAWLMNQAPVPRSTPETRLAFPFRARPLMGLWNALYLDAVPSASVDSAQSARWQRGEYLVNGLGHCSACHSPRNALGAERGGSQWLAGAMIDGWEAPGLGVHSRAPQPWSEAALYAYLSTGVSASHGSASGPMAPVIEGLAQMPDEDRRAMAHYLASLAPPKAATRTSVSDAAPSDSPAQGPLLATYAAASGSIRLDAAPDRWQRQFDASCGACHHESGAPMQVPSQVPLSASTKLHSERPDNLLRVMLAGVRAPAGPDVGYMPAFADSLDDAQVAGLAAWMRARFAASQPAWSDLVPTVARLRNLRSGVGVGTSTGTGTGVQEPR